MNNNILLETGTGEVELLEFVIGDTSYGINVIKVREVLEVDMGSITKLPCTHPAVTGLLLCRQEIITLIDLKYVLENQKKTDKKFLVVICEFNKIKVAFSIDGIRRVHRIKWQQILKPDDVSANPLVIGNIIFDNNVIQMLDFEKVITDISPSTGISEERIVKVDYKDRPNAKVILADDSPLIRTLITDTLRKAGFKNLMTFDDGMQALRYLEGVLEEKGDKFMEDVNILITDIEMPQMDGFTLTRNIKKHSILKKLPVIIFSSLITDDLKHKGDSVGADAQLSKPEIGELVKLIDKLI